MKKLIAALSCALLMAGCCNEDFIIPSSSTNPIDLRADALDVTDLFDVDPSCSTPNPIYTSIGATPDGGLGSCWMEQTNSGDVWFKFTAQPPYGYASIWILVEGPEGTQQFPQLVLWDTDGVTELACDGYDSEVNDLYIFYGNLVIGEEYYFSVSVADDAFKGTFTMCVTTSD